MWLERGGGPTVAGGRVAGGRAAAVFKTINRGRRIMNEVVVVDRLMSFSFSKEIETPLLPPVANEKNTQCRKREKRYTLYISRSPPH